jgi:hypothetical protein
MSHGFLRINTVLSSVHLCDQWQKYIFRPMTAAQIGRILSVIDKEL